MKTPTVRLSDMLATRLEQESLTRRSDKSDIVRERLALLPSAQAGHPLANILAEIDSRPVRGLKRNAAHDTKRLPDTIRAHYHTAKRHYRQ